MRRPLTLLPVALLPVAVFVGCGGEDKPVAAGTTPPSGASDVETELPEDPGLPEVEGDFVSPSMSAEEVADALTLALSNPPNSSDSTAAYRMLMTQGDDFCPGSEYFITDIRLYGCDASTGYFFAGVSDWLEEELDPELGLFLEGVAGDFWIITPDGELFEAGGHSVYMWSEHFWIRELGGSWIWQGGDPWIASGFSGSLTIEEDYRRGIRLSGGAQIQGVSWSATDLMFASACDYGPLDASVCGTRGVGGIGWSFHPATRARP